MVNPLYMQQKTIAQVMQMFKAQKDLPSIQLPNFFTASEYKTLKSRVSKLKLKKIYDPLKYRMEFAPVANVKLSEDVTKFISMVLGKKVMKLKLQAFSFTHTDYTLICDEDGKKPGIEVMLDFSDDWNQLAGGSAVYVDGTGEYFKIPPKGNSLTLIKRPKKNMKKFIQYVNALSGKKKRIFLMATIGI